MATELSFGYCPRCKESHLPGEHSCQSGTGVTYHCLHCGGDYSVGQSHECVSREAETVTLLRQILDEFRVVRDHLEHIRWELEHARQVR